MFYGGMCIERDQGERGIRHTKKCLRDDHKHREYGEYIAQYDSLTLSIFVGVTGVGALEQSSVEGDRKALVEQSPPWRSLQTLPLPPVDVEEPVYHGLDNVDEGDLIVITCRMSRFYAPRWTHNDHDIELVADGRISFNYSEGFQASRVESIVIRNAKPSDSGAYRCSSRSRNGHFINVIALRPRPSVWLKDKMKETVILSKDGELVILTCKQGPLNSHSPVIW